MKAGAARIEITPPVGRRMAGYASRTQASIGVHDPLLARALVCEGDEGTAVALVAADLIEFPEWLYLEVAREVGARTGIPPERLQVLGIHTHGGPEFEEGGAWEAELVGRLSALVAEAFAGMREARLAVGTGRITGIGVNRRGPQGPVDHDLTVLRIDGDDGRAIATLMNYGCHPTTLGPDNLLYTADYPGVACSLVDQAAAGVAIFTTGAQGDVNPGGYSAEGSMIGEVVTWRNYASAQRYGQEVARVALAVREQLRPEPAARVWGRMRMISVPRKALPTPDEADREVARARAALEQLQRSGTAEQVIAARKAAVYAQILAAQAADPDREQPVRLRVSALGIGPVVHVGVPGELFAELGMQIKQEVGPGRTLVAVFTNGSMGYIPTREAIEGGGYEPAASIMTAEGGELIARAAANVASGTADPVLAFETEGLPVTIYESREAMGAAAAAAVAERLRDLLARQRGVRITFAAAPSQAEVLAHLAAAPGIDWERVTAFHLDEYLGLPVGHPSSFRAWLDQHLFGQVRFGRINYLSDMAGEPAEQCRRYAELLARGPLDIACIGIGENGHIAFNDPQVADFADLQAVKVVDLDETCRMQQVHDGCFPALADVPAQALTLTIPTIMAARTVFVVVPGSRKARAVCDALTGPVTAACPASVLRRHGQAQIYLDQDAASLLTPPSASVRRRHR
jgi:glucosamine-6-phosphate deaminase